MSTHKAKKKTLETFELDQIKVYGNQIFLINKIDPLSLNMVNLMFDNINTNKQQCNGKYDLDKCTQILIYYEAISELGRYFIAYQFYLSI